MSSAAFRVVQSLSRAEAEIGLLARCQPTNWAALRSRVLESWSAGQRRTPAFEFAPAPDLSQLRRALEALGTWVGQRESWGEIWGSRARELGLEAELAENVGKESLRRLAPERFRNATGLTGRALRRLALRWAQADADALEGAPIASDDETNPESLVALMRRELTLANIGVSVRFSERLAARAAVDDTSVWIKPGVYLRLSEAKRIVVHEVHGHVLRRHQGRRREHLPFRCGVSGADADEEGRALWLEAQAGFMSATRKIELGRRHLAADACQRGASFCETIELLLGLGTPLEQALALGLRVWRGGGIAREIIYLPGYWRACRHLETSPDLESWMRRGRLSFEVATWLSSGKLSL